MWLWLSLTALLCWSGSDLFSKIGCRDGSDKYSHLKMVIAVGVVMGLHAAFEIFVGGTAISWSVIWDLPAGFPSVYQLYGPWLSGPAVYRTVRVLPHLQLLRRTGSGADAGFRGRRRLLSAGAVCHPAGVRRCHRSRRGGRHRGSGAASRAAEGRQLQVCQELSRPRPPPAAYCLLDAAGTFADNRVLEILTDRYMNAGMYATLEACSDQAAASANCAYELTFLAAAVFCFIYVVLIKKDRLIPQDGGPQVSGRRL